MLSFEYFRKYYGINGAFALKEQMLHFHNIFKYMTFQRRQKAAVYYGVKR